MKEAAANLYKIMRKIKDKGYKKIYVSKIPKTGLGLAINDRLKGHLNSVYRNKKTYKDL